jgi:hypothetical protein
MRGRGASDLIVVSSHLSTRHLRPGDRLSSPALSRLAFHKRFSPGWDNCRRASSLYVASSQLPLASFKPVLGNFADALWIISISRSNVSTMRG